MVAISPQNPFLITGTDQPSTELRARGITSTGAVVDSALPIVGAGGEYNASDKRDLFQQLNTVIAAAQNGRISRSANAAKQDKFERLASAIRAAHFSNDAANFGVLGEEITNEIRTTIARTGFIRRFLQERELVAGEETKVLLRKNDVLAFSLSTDGTTPMSHIKQREIYLRENYVNANIQIEEKEIARLRADLLQEKLTDGFEATMVQEDKQLKVLADNASAALNVPVFFSSLTPAVYVSLKNQVQSRGVPVTSCWLANNLWNDIFADPAFVGFFDQVSKHELVLTGEIGVLGGVTLHTDAFINSQLRVLNSGEIYFFSDPATLGQLLIRKALQSDPVNKNVLGIPARGWFLSEIIAPMIANANGVSKGQRL